MGRMPKRIKNHAFHLSCVSNYWWNFNYQEKNTNHESKLILWERSFWSSLFNPAESTGILQVRHCFQWGPSPSLTVSAIASPKSCLLFSRSRRACRETKRLVKCTEKVSAKSKKKRHKMLSCEQWPNATLKSYEVRRILEWSIMEQVFTVQMWTTNRSRWNSRSTTLPDFAWSIAERRGTKDNHKRRKDFAPWFPLAWVVQELTPGQMLPVNDCLNAMLMPYDIPSTFEILFLQFTPNSSFDFRILKLGVFGIEGGLSISCFILLAGGSWLSRLSKSMEKLWAFGWSVDWIRPEAEGFLSPQKAPKKWRLQRHFCESEILQCKQCLP